MRYTFEEEFRLDRPETVGETDRRYDLENYKDWLEAQLIEARKQLALYNVAEQSEQLCGWFLPDSTISSATRCQRCGREKWEHPETI